MSMISDGQRVKHLKTDRTYRVVSTGYIQTDRPLLDYAPVVVYRPENAPDDEELWVRPVKEFEDGRFEHLPYRPERAFWWTMINTALLLVAVLFFLLS